MRWKVRIYKDPHTGQAPVSSGVKFVAYKGHQGSMGKYKLDIRFNDNFGAFAIELPKKWAAAQKDEVWHWIADNIQVTGLDHQFLVASLEDLILFKLRWEGQIVELTDALDAGSFYCPYIPLTMTGVRAVSSTFTPSVNFKTRYDLNL